jgi:hypothetical protein
MSSALVVGAVCTLAATAWLRGFIDATAVTNVGLLVMAVALALGAVAMIACWIPARRAMQVDPIEGYALRVIAPAFDRTVLKRGMFFCADPHSLPSLTGKAPQASCLWGYWASRRVEEWLCGCTHRSHRARCPGVATGKMPVLRFKHG